MGKSEYFEVRKVEGEVEQPQIILRTMTRQEIEDRKNVLFSLVRDREAKLKETDYVAAKIAEGAATKEEYAAVLSQRRAWRGEINEAEAEVAALDAEVPEDEDAVSAEATEGRP